MIDILKKSKNLNYSSLPNHLEKKIKKSINKGFEAIALLNKIPEAEEKILIASTDYRPKLIQVRRIELLNREIETQIKILTNQIEITNNNKDEIKKALISKLENLKLKSSGLISSIPNTWNEEYKIFNNLVKTDKMLRTKYRRLSDQFYYETSELLNILKGNEKFYALEDRIKEFKFLLEKNYENKTLVLSEIKELGKRLSSLDDRGKMKSHLSKIKRKIKKKKININNIMKDYDNFNKIYLNKSKWLKISDEELRSDIEILLNNTSKTLGARSQKKLPRETALFIAK